MVRPGVQQMQQSRLRMGGGTGARGVATGVGKQNSLFAALAARGEMGRRSLGGQGLTTEGAMGTGRGRVAVPGHPQRSHGGWDSGPLHSPGGPNTGGGVGGRVAPSSAGDMAGYGQGEGAERVAHPPPVRRECYRSGG